MLGGISIWQLLIILLIVIMLFGTKKLKNVGGDLGEAIKGFKKGLKDEDKAELAEDKPEVSAQKVEDKAESKDSKKS